jgi:hypothetical protein
MSLDEVAGLARAGSPRYVLAHGRVSSDEEFPDENQRPLVYRRRRVQRVGVDGRWQDLDDERVAVPFGIEDRETFVGVDAAALGEGLVVVPRLAEGSAAELPDDWRGRLPTLEPSARVRVRVDQVSAVEHASVAGVPALDAAGVPMLSSGAGRPLVLTTLEPDAAMRVLAAPHRRTVQGAALLLVAGLGLLAVGFVTLLIGL